MKTAGPDIPILLQKAVSKKNSFRKTIERLKSLKPVDADELFAAEHELAFSEFDCLSCANCCKTTPPLLLNEDINRISRHLRMTSKDFMAKYVKRDEDGDTVFNSTPCPFLGSDHYCSIYKERPKACREYPHTNRKKMHRILDLTLKNAEICPAVARILSNIEQTLHL
jgi:Fe-S-cluster containining protein